MERQIKDRITARPPFTEEQKERFLMLIGDGLTRQEAAARLQSECDAEGIPCYSTASRWKGVTFRDPEFATRYLEALAESDNDPPEHVKQVVEKERVRLAHRLFDEAIIRALDPERGKVGASNRVLHNLALLTVEHFKPLLEARTRHIHEGAVGVYALPQIDTDKWSLEEHDEFVALRERMNELLAKARPDNAPSLETAQLPAGEIVDAEAVEIS